MKFMRLTGLVAAQPVHADPAAPGPHLVRTWSGSVEWTLRQCGVDIAGLRAAVAGEPISAVRDSLGQGRAGVSPCAQW